LWGSSLSLVRDSSSTSPLPSLRPLFFLHYTSLLLLFCLSLQSIFFFPSSDLHLPFIAALELDPSSCSLWNGSFCQPITGASCPPTINHISPPRFLPLSLVPFHSSCDRHSPRFSIPCFCFTYHCPPARLALCHTTPPPVSNDLR
jgi:hypothetical protein